MSQEDNRLTPQQLLSHFYPYPLTTLPTTMYSTVLQVNDLLFTEQDVTNSTCEGSSKKHITHVDQVHHPHTFIRDQYRAIMYLYPSNISIQRHFILPGVRDQGIHGLKGIDGIWAGAIITDRAQAYHASYPGMGVPQAVMLDC